MGILTLVRANLRHRKSNFISIFILMTLVSLILTSTISIDDNVTRRASNGNDEVRTGDIVAFIHNEYFTDEMKSKLEQSKYIENVKINDVFLSSETIINGIKPDATIYFSAYDPDEKPYGIFNDKINGFIDDPEPLNDGEIYLPVVYKDMCCCKTGDSVSIKLFSKTVSFTVAGFVEDPFTGGDVMAVKNLFITRSDLDRILRESANVEKVYKFAKEAAVVSFKLIDVYAKDEYLSNIDQLSRILNEETEVIDYSFYWLSKENSNTYTLILPKILCGVLYLFLVLLMIVVTMVLSNNIGTNIEMEYLNIGILKSQGFSKGLIRLVFLIQYLIPAVSGVVIGLLLSIPSVSFIRLFFITSSGLMVSNQILLGRSLVILFVIMSMVCVFIYLKTAKIANISPVRAISGGLSDIHFSSIFRTPVLVRNRSLIGVRLAFRQLTTNLRQYMWVCLILSFLVCYLSTCCAFKENFTQTFYDELYGTVSSDVCVKYINFNIRNDVEKNISSISPLKGSFEYQEYSLFMDGVSYTAQMLGDFSYIKNITDGKAPEHDNEIMLTNLLSKKINKTVGDTVTIRQYKQQEEYIICGLYDSIVGAGKTFAIDYYGANPVVEGLEPLKIRYIIEDSTQSEKINKMLTEKYNSKDIKIFNPKNQSKSTIRTVMDAMNSMIFFIFIIAVIFTVIVIWMVCNKSFLKERTDIGIYKAYGFSSFSLKMQFCFRYMIIAVAAGITGDVLYIFFGDAINMTTLMTLGITKFHAPVTATSLVLPLVIVFFFVFCSSYITLGKIDKVSTRELIVE